MPQPNQGKPAPSAPTQAPMTDGKKMPVDPHIHFGAPGGKGTKGK